MKPEDRLLPQNGGAFVLDKEGKLQPDASPAARGEGEAAETKPAKEKR